MVDRLRAPLAGAAAGAAEVMITMPFEVTKNRMQLAGAGSSQSVIKSMAETIASAGPTGLYYGVQAQMLQVCGKSGIRFAVYDQLQRVVPNQPFISGALALALSSSLFVAPRVRCACKPSARAGVHLSRAPTRTLRARLRVATGALLCSFV